jgi:hypothetical protein
MLNDCGVTRSSSQLAGLAHFSLADPQLTAKWSVSREAVSGVLLRTSQYVTTTVALSSTCTDGVEACWSKLGSVAEVLLT